MEEIFEITNKLTDLLDFCGDENLREFIIGCVEDNCYACKENFEEYVERYADDEED